MMDDWTIVAQDGPVQLWRWPIVAVYTLTRHGEVVGGLHRTRRNRWECWHECGESYEWFENEDFGVVYSRLWRTR